MNTIAIELLNYFQRAFYCRKKSDNKSVYKVIIVDNVEVVFFYGIVWSGQLLLGINLSIILNTLHFYMLEDKEINWLLDIS